MTFPLSATITERISDGISMSSSDSTETRLSASELKNIVEQYLADPDNYLNFHTVLNQVVSIIGEGRIVQKLDIFSKKKYTAEPSNQFLQQKYSEHFDGRLV